jgi:hypothetical protein
MDKEDKKWRRRFIAFLKENEIYEKWIYNMKRQHPASNAAWWNLFYRIYENRCSEGINHAFYWTDTEEGHEYWSFYDRLWKCNCGVI